MSEKETLNSIIKITKSVSQYNIKSTPSSKIILAKHKWISTMYKEILNFMDCIL